MRGEVISGEVFVASASARDADLLLEFVREVLTYISYFDTEFEAELLQVISTETYDLHRLTEGLRERGFRLSRLRASASESESV